ncbi:hypothetical protein V1478_015210 [Vespula squamosa]|uniref:Uncharacterized protein n=1 Tax=Vespula squamosa TaxID=30214 RepID=A0ABD2A4U7_VESSQ
MKIYLSFDEASKVKNIVTVSVALISEKFINFLYILLIFSSKQSHLITINLILKYNTILLFSYLVQSNRLKNRVISMFVKCIV